MDWQSFIFGAFVSCALGFSASAAMLALIMRRQYLFWFMIRALAVGMMVLTFPPAGTLLFPNSTAFWVARLGATDIAIAVVGPLLATYMEPSIEAPALRRFLWLLCPLGLILAVSTPLFVQLASLYWVHNLLILGLVLMVVAGLFAGIRLGSRTFRIQAVAFTPAILTGFTALYFELVLLRSMPLYTEAMLAAFMIEFVVTAAGIGDGFVTIRRQLDAAVVSVKEATRASTLDPLTGIANRRGLAQHFADPAVGRPRALAVIDCDHFKRINDNFGHDVGDEVLVAVARSLQGEGIYVGRLGGEEFAALIYHDDWQVLAEVARRRIETGVRMSVPQLAFRVTASAGLSPVDDEDTLATVLKRADKALYAAKDAGRNRLLVVGRAERVPAQIVASVG